ncbi:MAG: peptide chain release factor 1 [Rickettsiales bacterium]|nr:peptide chain release factor 1 [Rickettsiales bacterium]
MFNKLDQVESRFKAIGDQLSHPEIAANQQRFRELMQEYSHLRPICETFAEYRDIEQQIGDAREMLSEEDPEMRSLAQEELAELEPKVEPLRHRLKILLLPKDPNEGRNVILEIRAGVGGDEAGLFAADLFRMYSRYGESRGWKFELMNLSQNEAGGYKEVITSIAGADVYKRLKYESGVHRVQRVPATEAQGRIHTSTCTVALMPEAEEVDVHIEDKDLRIDVFRASGPGGQSVNTTDSAVRLTHLPSGLVVICQDEKSQHKNKAKALKVLRTRLYEKERAEQQAEQRDLRLSQVGTGDRSERIRTYNFPQGRLTDHRIGLTLYNVDRIVEGELDEVLDSCATHFEAAMLQAVEQQ